MKIKTLFILIIISLVCTSHISGKKFFELWAKNFSKYPFKRSENNHKIISSTRYLDVLNRMDLNKNEILLSKESEEFREEYEKHLIKSAAYIATFIGDLEYAVHFDNALYYAYTYQDLNKHNKVFIEEKYINYITKVYQHYPQVVQLTYWPWTADGKLNGLYYPGGTSSGNIIQISLYDTFSYNAILEAMKNQDPDFVYDDGWEDIIGKLGKELAEKMPILETFIHENTHCVFQFCNSRGHGTAGSRVLTEGVTEFLTHRTIYYIAGAHEDFNGLTAYPWETLIAGLLFSIDPGGLLDWYIAEHGNPNAVYAESIANKLMEIKDVHTGKSCLPPGRKQEFKKIFIDKILSGNLQDKSDVLYPFTKTSDVKILYDWMTQKSIYFKQIPLRHRIYILDNFFGKSGFVTSASIDKFKTKIKDTISKTKRQNWNSQKKHTIMGLIADDESKSNSKCTPISVVILDDNISGDLNTVDLGDLKGKENILVSEGYIADGPEDLPTKNKEVKNPLKDQNEDRGGSVPNVEEWFKNYWSSHGQPSDKKYANMRNDLINNFSFAKIVDISNYLIENKSSKDNIAEWHDFLADFIVPQLEEGKDNLKLHVIKGLLEWD